MLHSELSILQACVTALVPKVTCSQSWHSRHISAAFLAAHDLATGKFMLQPSVMTRVDCSNNCLSFKDAVLAFYTCTEPAAAAFASAVRGLPPA